MSSLSELGLYGYYYGDFFVLPSSFSLSSNSLTFSSFLCNYSFNNSSSSSYSSYFINYKMNRDGIYHYLNHPYSVLSCFYLHGIALILNNNLLLIIGIIIQTFSLLLLFLVEIPTMNVIYGKGESEGKDGVIIGLKQICNRNVNKNDKKKER